MLNKKIAVTDAEAAHQEKQKEEAKTTKPTQRQEQSTADAVGKSVLKVLTSATFIREHWGF
jgi:hypothetical protein